MKREDAKVGMIVKLVDQGPLSGLSAIVKIDGVEQLCRLDQIDPIDDLVQRVALAIRDLATECGAGEAVWGSDVNPYGIASATGPEVDQSRLNAAIKRAIGGAK